LGVTQNSDGTLVFHNQHHWVTATGDTINVSPAYATAFPTSVPGFYATSYLNGAAIAGGTGRFKNAHGNVFAWGAVNTGSNELALRDEGEVCFAQLDQDQ
jgi:hypothetical protein